MPLYLTETDVERLLTMREATEAIDGAFKRQGEGQVLNQSRRRIYMPNGIYHMMAAADLGLETFGIKVYTAFRPAAKFLFLLYSATTGELLSIMEADRLGQMRTGAASGLATRYLARRDRRLQVGIIGTGWQARSQLMAVCDGCDVERITAYGRDAARRAAFCTEMSGLLGVAVEPAETPRAAVEGMDVVITATTAREPVLEGGWLADGAHLNVVGSNGLTRREVDDQTVKRSGLIVVDSIEQSKIESGDLLGPFERRSFRWESAVELAEVVSGRHPGRTAPGQITLFKSNGVALEDVAVATLVYRKAVAESAGKTIEMWQAGIPETA
jgi:ornithine cyclodeaminase/alanine dehydrogenase-like protein (mu-crystallin family)